MLIFLGGKLVGANFYYESEEKQSSGGASGFSWIFIHDYMWWIKKSSNMGNAAEEVPNK